MAICVFRYERALWAARLHGAEFMYLVLNVGVIRYLLHTANLQLHVQEVLQRSASMKVALDEPVQCAYSNIVQLKPDTYRTTSSTKSHPKFHSANAFSFGCLCLFTLLILRLGLAPLSRLLICFGPPHTLAHIGLLLPTYLPKGLNTSTSG